MKVKSQLPEDTSVMTYRGHVVLRTLIRSKFSPANTTGQRYIYTGCASGRVVGEYRGNSYSYAAVYAIKVIRRRKVENRASESPAAIMARI